MDSAWKLIRRRFKLPDLRGSDGFFGPRQAAWMAEQIKPGGPGTILLSHHQPFSRVQRGPDGIDINGNLLDQTDHVRQKPGLKAWFWGHEHRCLTYGSRYGIDYAACVGHGAIPEYVRPSYVEPPEWELTAVALDDDDDIWRRCGFAWLDLSPDTIRVHYIDQYGNRSKEPDTISHD